VSSVLDETDEFRLELNSEPTLVRKTVRDLLKHIDDCVPASESLDDLRLIFSELLYNAVIHGNKKEPGKRVLVQLKTRSDRVYVSIEDEGPGYDYNRLMEYARSDAALMDEGGRGMVLVCALTENLKFNEAGNQVCFEVRL